MRWNSSYMLHIFNTLLLEQLLSLSLTQMLHRACYSFPALLWNSVTSFHFSSSHLGRRSSSLASLLFPGYLMTPLFIYYHPGLQPWCQILFCLFILASWGKFFFLTHLQFKERKPICLPNIREWYRISKFHNIKS